MFLHAVGHFHPENVIDTHFLVERIGLDTTEEWIVGRVGIRQRHTVLSLDYLAQTKNQDPSKAQAAALHTNADTGRRAALLALERARLKPGQIGLVIAGGCSPDECIPAEACRIAEALGIQSPAFDLNAACASFGAQLHFLTGMRPERLPDYILVVNPENNTRVIDYRDRTSCVLWGDATAAAIVSPRVPGPWRITQTLLGGDPAGADKVKVPRFGHFIQDGAAVHRFAIERASELVAAMAATHAQRGGEKHELSFIGHQANLRMLEQVARRSGIDALKHFSNIERRGNCGAAGAPSVLSENWDNPALGDAVALAVVGSGLTWAGALFERA